MSHQEDAAREVIDAIRLALWGAANDRDAVVIIKTILADAPAERVRDTGPVRRLVRAAKRIQRGHAKQASWVGRCES